MAKTIYAVEKNNEKRTGRVPGAAGEPPAAGTSGAVKKILSVVFGLAIGFINGFFGGGGGMVCVPFLEKILKKPTKTSHATAILIILPISAVSAAVYIIAKKFEWQTGLPAGGGVIAGGLLGALLLSKMSNGVIRIIFAAVMIIAGGKLLFF